jgi:IS5 family transposase
MEKNIVHPTDGRLYEKVRRKLVGLAREAGVSLRQTYNRLAPRLCGQVCRYAHARQFKRMRKALHRLKGYAGRVLRDVERQMDEVAEGALKLRLQDLLALVNWLLAQRPKDRRKLLSYDFSRLLRQKGATARHAIYGGQHPGAAPCHHP